MAKFDNMTFNQLLMLFKVLHNRADSINTKDCRFKYYYAKACRVSDQLTHMHKALHLAGLPVGNYGEQSANPG